MSLHKLSCAGPIGPIAYRWFTCERPVGRLLVAHGISEYGRRYEPMGHALAALGWELLVHDHRGHGDSPGTPGHVDDFLDYVADARAFHEHAARAHPWSGPQFLLGHSMGGLVAARYVLEHAQGLDGLVLSAPLLGLRARVPLWKEAASLVLSRVLPRLTMRTGFDPNLLSRDALRVADYLADPKIHRRASTRWYQAMKRALACVHARAAEIDLPLLVLHGSEDALTCPATSRAFCEAAGGEHRLLDGLYHELLQETCRDELYRMIVDWMRAR